MERRMRTARRAGLPLLAALASVALTLAACDSTNVLALLTTEVKRSTGKLLVVSSVTPSNTTTNVNPGARMTVTFDRALDMSTVNASTVTITPIPSATDAPGFHLDFSYNDATKTLYVDSDPWLGDSTDYTLTVTTGVKGADGSQPEKDYAWSFRTGIAPKGILKIEADKAFTNKKGSGQILSFDIRSNVGGYEYAVAGSEAAFQDPISLNWSLLTSTISNGNTAAGYYLAAGALDGLQTVYYQFRIAGPTYSVVRSDTITLDTVPPTVTGTTPIYINGASANQVVASAAGTDDRSGVDSATFVWTPVAGASFSATTASSPTITVTGGDATYPVTVTVKDNAGNTSSAATVNVIKDTVAPNTAPVLVGPSSPAFNPPRWDWSRLVSASGGEATALFAYSVVDGLGGVFYSTASTTGLYYLRGIKWPDRSRAMQPGSYTLTIHERDLAGNTGPDAPASVTVTSVLPANGATGLALAPTLQWWAMTNPKDPRYATDSYGLHWGVLDRAGRFTESGRAKVAQPVGVDPSYTLPALTGLSGYTWYVDDLTFGQRSPSAATSYWTFSTGKF